jgi:hypothetical protein
VILVQARDDQIEGRLKRAGIRGQRAEPGRVRRTSVLDRSTVEPRAAPHQGFKVNEVRIGDHLLEQVHGLLRWPPLLGLC